MKAVILAGGLGSRLAEETHLKPKPMIEIGGKPILWHIMKIYGEHGINDFVICLGYKGHIIKEFFANYALYNSDVTFDLANSQIEINRKVSEPWHVTLVETGLQTQTGGRLGRIRNHVDGEDFCLTYGDGVSDVDVGKLVQFHQSHESLVTVTVVQPQGRYGAVEMVDDKVAQFIEKPKGDGGWVNGGFFVVSPKALDAIERDQASWEYDALPKLASLNHVTAFKHHGFWQAMDTQRDKERLEQIWNGGTAPWKVWS